MDLQSYYPNENEKPLDRIAVNGGMTAIFRTMAFVGDSLLSGEFEIQHEDKSHSWHDIYEQSWGNYIARMTGSKAYLFSRGGMTALEFMESFAEKMNCFDPAKKAQCYVIALCTNDMTKIIEGSLEFGSMDDVSADETQCGKTFMGYMAAIIARYKKISPFAKFFLVTRARFADEAPERTELYDRHQKAIYELAEFFDNTFVIDLRKYGPECDAAMRKSFWEYGHMTPMGYKFTADIVASYIDYIIRNQPQSFKDVGLIGTDTEDLIPLMHR